MPPGLSERWIVLEETSVRLWVLEAKPPDPQNTLLFIHGFGGWAEQWTPQLESFSNHLRVIAPELRGHGRSDKPRSSYSLAEILEDLRAVVETLGVQSPFGLIGHSFGAAIAAQYAVQHPAQVEKLVLINPSSDYTLSPLINWVFSVPDRLFDGVLGAVNRLRKALDAPAFVLKALYWNALRPWRGEEVLPRLRVPTLVITPRRDPLFPERAVARVAELLPQGERLVLPSYSHMLMIDLPGEVNAAIARFFGIPFGGGGWDDRGVAQEDR